jgi:hypothetical protein
VPLLLHLYAGETSDCVMVLFDLILVNPPSS